MKNRVVAVVGPTAVGKTALGVKLAQLLNGEVINGDASQVYQEMKIGTAMVTNEEAEGVPHHLLDFVLPSVPYTVADFQKDARIKINEIGERGHLPIIVGGTGLYIKAALFDYRFTETRGNQKLRKELEAFVLENGNQALYARLLALNPCLAEKIHPNNVQRVIRAIEKAEFQKGAFHRGENAPPRPLYPLVVIGLTMDREDLYKRINNRVERMVADGLVHEARALYDQGLRGTLAAQSIGYKELFQYFDGEITLDEAKMLIKRNTRHFAKRQLTWFRHQMDVQWFDAKDIAINFSKIIHFVAGKFDDKSNNRV